MKKLTEIALLGGGIAFLLFRNSQAVQYQPANSNGNTNRQTRGSGAQYANLLPLYSPNNPVPYSYSGKVYSSDHNYLRARNYSAPFSREPVRRSYSGPNGNTYQPRRFVPQNNSIPNAGQPPSGMPSSGGGTPTGGGNPSRPQSMPAQPRPGGGGSPLAHDPGAPSLPSVAPGAQYVYNEGKGYGVYKGGYKDPNSQYVYNQGQGYGVYKGGYADPAAPQYVYNQGQGYGNYKGGYAYQPAQQSQSYSPPYVAPASYSPPYQAPYSAPYSPSAQPSYSAPYQWWNSPYVINSAWGSPYLPGYNTPYVPYTLQLQWNYENNWHGYLPWQDYMAA